MNRVGVAFIMMLTLTTVLASCTSGSTTHYIDTAELEAAKTELHQAQTAITSCLYDAGRTQLDSAAAAWDGRSGQVKCTIGTEVYDAADYLHVAAFKARYDVDLNGVIATGRNVSWLGIKWDSDARQWAPI